VNLTKALRAHIVEHFKAGTAIATLAHIYGRTSLQIEAVIRDALREKDGV